MGRLKIGKRLLPVCAFLCISAPELRAAVTAPGPAATSFAYAASHPVIPLPSSVIARTINTDGRDSDEADAFDAPHDQRVDVRIGPPRGLSRSGMCNAVVSVARANNLPIPFFANLIWQESSFNVKSISPAGALGVAQFMPQTAKEYGLINPFEPIHALHAAGKLLRRLQTQFGNLGLAAAAYNAGPGRVSNWMAKRSGLPGETRTYVTRITGREAEQWTSSEFVQDPEATLMPAKAPCVEVAQAVEAQSKIVRVAKLMAELAAVAKAPPRGTPNDDKFDEAAWQIAIAKPEWQAHALNVVRGVLKNISEQKIREAQTRPATKVSAKLAREWSRIADRTMKKAAEEFAKDSAEPEKPVESRRRGTRVAYSR